MNEKSVDEKKIELEKLKAKEELDKGEKDLEDGRKEYEDGKYLFMATKKGLVKKTPIQDYMNVRKTGLAAISLREDDLLIEVKVTDNDQDILLVTKYGQCIRFNEKDVRSTGRVSMGVRGMNLGDNDEIIGMQMSSQGKDILIVGHGAMNASIVCQINNLPIEQFWSAGLAQCKILKLK